MPALMMFSYIKGVKQQSDGTTTGTLSFIITGRVFNAARDTGIEPAVRAGAAYGCCDHCGYGRRVCGYGYLLNKY